MTERDQLLNSGLTPSTTHPYLKNGWVHPPALAEYPNLVVVKTPSLVEYSTPPNSLIEVTGFTWELDYLNTETGMFASEEAPLQMEWPWVDNFRPAQSDWEAIGIPALV